MSSQDVAYSYRRFSSLPQEAGDSVRRQTAKTEAWSERTGIPVDWSLRIDRGLSGFTMENLDLGSLGEFVKLVDRKRVKPGSYLVVESLDRLTRGFEQDALRVILNLTGAGIRIVQLEPQECIFDAKSDAFAIMRLIMDLTRGHQESVRKSGMIRDDRENKRKLARGGRKVAQRHPSWLKLTDGKWQLVEPQASIMRRIIGLALAGRGGWSIAHTLNADEVKPFGHGKAWAASTVSRLLTDGRAAGWYQPCSIGRKPEGQPIPDYYPRLMEQDELERLRGMFARRKGKAGRHGGTPNLFAHIITNAVNGHRLSLASAKTPSRGQSYLLLQSPAEVVADRSPTIAYLPFEYAVLACFAELPRVMMADEKAEDVDSLRGQLSEMEKQQASLIADILTQDSPTLRAVAKALDGKMAGVRMRLDAALRKLANAASDALGDAQSIIGRLYTSNDRRDERLRLREAIRSFVDDVRVVVVPRGVCRLIAAQMRFSSGRVRDYLVAYRRAMFVPSKGVQPVRVFYGSLTPEEGHDAIDFRDAEVVASVRSQLESMPIDALAWKELPSNVH